MSKVFCESPNIGVFVNIAFLFDSSVFGAIRFSRRCMMSSNNVAFAVPAVGRLVAAYQSLVRSAFRSVTVITRNYCYYNWILLLMLLFKSSFAQDSYFVGFRFCRWPGPTIREQRRSHAMEDWMAALKVTSSRDLLNQVMITPRDSSDGGGGLTVQEVNDW